MKGLTQPATITYYDKTSAFQTGQGSARPLRDAFSQGPPRLRRSGQESRRLRAPRAVTKYGTTVVQIGARKDEAKNMTEEDITGAIIRDLKTNTRTVCFVTGSGEHQIDDADRHGFFALQGCIGQGRIHGQVHQPARKGRSAGRLHRSGGRRPQERLPAARS